MNAFTMTFVMLLGFKLAGIRADLTWWQVASPLAFGFAWGFFVLAMEARAEERRKRP